MKRIIIFCLLAALLVIGTLGWDLILCSRSEPEIEEISDDTFVLVYHDYSWEYYRETVTNVMWLRMRSQHSAPQPIAKTDGTYLTYDEFVACVKQKGGVVA